MIAWPDRLGAARQMVPERVIELRRVRHAKAGEDVQRLGTVLRIVQHDMHDPGAERQLLVKVVGEGVIQALLVTYPACEGGEDLVGALVAFDQRGHWAV